MIPNVEYTHSAENSRDTTLDEEKYDVRYSQQRAIGKNDWRHIARRFRVEALQCAARSFRFGPQWRPVTLVVVKIWPQYRIETHQMRTIFTKLFIPLEKFTDQLWYKPIAKGLKKRCIATWNSLWRWRCYLFSI